MNYLKNNRRIEYFLYTTSVAFSSLVLFNFSEFIEEHITDITWLFLIFLFSGIISLSTGLFYLISISFFKVPYSKKLIPNFNGVWEGEGFSTYGDKQTFDVKFKIKQTLTIISINAYFSNSKSEILNCSVLKENDKEKLIYSYLNTPKNISKKLDKHYGTVILEKLSKEEITGNYFTDRKEQTKGTFELRKVKSG